MMEVPSAGPRKHTTQPILTGTSVVAFKYADGVMMSADTLASYGSMARFTTMDRLHAVGRNTLIGCSGDLSDFRVIKEYLNELVVNDVCADDGYHITAPEIYAYMSRVNYNRRSKGDPFWTSIVVGGVQDGKSFLGVIDKLGMCYEDNFLATGFANHLGIPLLRNEWRPDLTAEEAKTLMDNIMRVLYYRDARSLNKLTTGTITADGPSISKPYMLETKWDFPSFVRTKSGSSNAGSW